MTTTAPNDLLYATDPARALVELLAWPLALPVLAGAARGSGQPVLVLPGLLAGDLSTGPLRAFLSARGFDVHGWQLGRNLGPTLAVESGLRRRVAQLADRAGAPVALLGWSLGGIYARSAAVERPDLVTQVITLGTPFAMVDPGQTRAQAAYDRYSHLHAPGRELPVPAEIAGPLPVPATSIWSRTDGIVSWRASLSPASPTAEDIAVHSSHLGLGHHPAVLYAVADRLAQPAGEWRPFVAPRRLRALYPAV